MIEFKWSQVLLSPLFFLALGLPSLFLLLFAEPYQRGIYCDDESIQYPKLVSIFAAALVASLCFAIPLVGIILCEVWRLRIERKANYVPIVYVVGERTVHRLLVRLYVFLGYWLFGAAMTQFVEDVLKYGTGRPRPNFVAVCIPDWSKMNCTKNNYAHPVPCLQTDWFLAKDARLSFPSGHAAFAFYNFVFFLLYIEARVYWTILLPIVKPFIQCLLVAFATGIALSVVSDYHHHALDAIAGSILGIVAAIITGLYVCKLFDRREIPDGRSDLKPIVLSSLLLERV